MSNEKLNLILSDFEKTTVEQLVSYKVAKNKNESDECLAERIQKLINSEALIKESVLLCLEWNRKRILLGLPMFT